MNKKFITDLESLKESCKKFSETIFALDVWELNSDFPRPSEISKSSSEWRIFVEDVKEFLKNYQIDEADNIRQLLNANRINKHVIEDLKVCLHRAGIQANSSASAGGLVLKWKTADNKPALARVEISADGKSRRFVVDFNLTNSVAEKVWDEFWKDLLFAFSSSDSPELRKLYDDIVKSNPELKLNYSIR